MSYNSHTDNRQKDKKNDKKLTYVVILWEIRLLIAAYHDAIRSENVNFENYFEHLI